MAEQVSGAGWHPYGNPAVNGSTTPRPVFGGAKFGGLEAGDVNAHNMSVDQVDPGGTSHILNNAARQLRMPEAGSFGSPPKAGSPMAGKLTKPPGLSRAARASQVTGGAWDKVGEFSQEYQDQLKNRVEGAGPASATAKAGFPSVGGIVAPPSTTYESTDASDTAGNRFGSWSRGPLFKTVLSQATAGVNAVNNMPSPTTLNRSGVSGDSVF